MKIRTTARAKIISMTFAYLLILSFGITVSDLTSRNSSADVLAATVNFINASFGESGRYNWAATYAAPNSGNARTFDMVYHQPMYYAGESPGWIMNWGYAGNESHGGSLNLAWSAEHFPANDPSSVDIGTVKIHYVSRSGNTYDPAGNLSYTFDYPGTGLIDTWPLDDANWTTYPAANVTWTAASYWRWHSYDITDSRNWSISDFYDNLYNFRVLLLFNFDGGLHPNIYIDYIGFSFDYVDRAYHPFADIDSGEFQSNFMGLIWLLFLPGIAINQAVPKIGLPMGLAIMLLIFGMTQPGFMATSVIGLVGVGVLYYKGA